MTTQHKSNQVFLVISKNSQGKRVTIPVLWWGWLSDFLVELICFVTGKVGDWKNHFTVAQNQQMQGLVAKHFKDNKYFHFEWDLHFRRSTRSMNFRVGKIQQMYLKAF